MKRVQRILALVLTLALCAGLLPMALAADAGAQYEKTAG